MRNRILLLTVLVASATLLAQEQANQSAPMPSGAHPLELAMDYGTVHTNGPPGNCSCFWMQGGAADLSVGLFSNVSAVGEFSSYYAGNANSTGQSLGLASYLFGFRYSVRTKSQLVPFGQALFGGVHGFDGIFPNSNGTLGSPNTFAMAVGGGMNVNLSRHFGLRVFQADYYLTQLPNDVNSRQNNLRISAGVVFRFRGK